MIVQDTCNSCIVVGKHLGFSVVTHHSCANVTVVCCLHSEGKEMLDFSYGIGEIKKNRYACFSPSEVRGLLNCNCALS